MMQMDIIFFFSNDRLSIILLLTFEIEIFQSNFIVSYVNIFIPSNLRYL